MSFGQPLTSIPHGDAPVSIPQPVYFAPATGQAYNAEAGSDHL